MPSVARIRAAAGGAAVVDIGTEARFDPRHALIPFGQSAGHRLDCRLKGRPFVAERAINGVDQLCQALDKGVLGLGVGMRRPDDAGTEKHGPADAGHDGESREMRAGQNK